MQVLLLHTARAAHGCTILVTFDHMLGDATSLMMFVQAWSAAHKQMNGEVLRDDAEMSMPATFSYPTTAVPAIHHPNPGMLRR